MSDSVNLSTFPSGRVDALTMLYLERQDLSNMSPEELTDMYLEVHSKIITRFSEVNKIKKQKKVINRGIII